MRSIVIAIILIVLVVGGVLIYQRDAATSIGDTLRSVKESSQDAATTSKVKTALLLSKHVSAFDVKARTKLDHFVLATLAEKGLTPSPEADPRTLIRRACVDLIGLRPTYDEVEAYASDNNL